MHLITQKASPLCIAVKYFIGGQASAAAQVLHVQSNVCVRACCIRWSAMAFCFFLRAIFGYIYILGASEWRVSVCVCVCVCVCV